MRGEGRVGLPNGSSVFMMKLYVDGEAI